MPRAKKSSIPTVIEAAVELVYAARRARVISPQGEAFSGNRWYPSDSENADNYTSAIRSPSYNWPWSYLKAAGSRRHIKDLSVAKPTFVLEQAESALRWVDGGCSQRVDDATRDAAAVYRDAKAREAAAAPAAGVQEVVAEDETPAATPTLAMA